MSKAIHILFVLAMMIPASLMAQGLGENLGEFYSYGDRYFFEIVTLPGSSSKARVLIPFRLAYDLMTFRKAPTRRDVERYVATPEMYVEAVASDGVIADRALWRDTLTVNSFSATNAKDRFVPGAVEMHLRPGMYRFKYTLADEGPGSGMTEETQPIRIDDFESPSPAIGMPLFLRRISGDTLIAGAISGSARFGDSLRVFIPLAGASVSSSLHYELLSVPEPEKGEKVSKGPFTHLQSGSAKLLMGRTLGTADVSMDDIRFVLRDANDSAMRSGGAIIDAPIDDLAPGDYMLLLTYGAGQGTVTDSVRFRLRWIDQPVSLYRASYAIRAMYPIATDQEIDALLDGKPDQQAALDRFWSQRDPTPQTQYNEAMVEYYRRVDYAFFNFRTIGQKDGAFTDRGKIYMLYGPPSDVDRHMNPDAYPREVWTYRINRPGAPKMNREFVFIDQSKTGAYRLVEYHDL